ncbi:MAG: peptide deformylase [Patescibacteria group bacterium]
MAKVPVIQAPNEILNAKCTPVGANENVQELVANLLDTLRSQRNPEGAGLAAPQIGINKRVCIVRKYATSKDSEIESFKEYVLINPEITSMSDATDIKWEGCLSIPDTYGKVQRAKRVKVIALNEKGEKIKIKAEGFFARVIQHEVDHLNGILFTSKTIGETLTEKELDSLMKG